MGRSNRWCILHQSKYLYFVTIISDSTHLWAYQSCYLAEVRKKKCRSPEGKKFHFPHFYASMQKTYGEDRFFSLVPEVLEVYAHRILLDNI